ncbi:MAG: proton-conducting transporter membrane subunit [Gammaproteobacteria bacterium]|nr:proton-conducting transporter membrane subunit [Gammaproteobacteria bacterium]
MLLRLFVVADLAAQPAVLSVIGVVAILSMLVGNVLALRSDNVKRILAYSSTAQIGYLLVALVAIDAAGPSLSVESCTYFLLAYLVTTLGAFGVVTVMSIADADNDADDISQYEGLLWRRPALASFMAAMLLSLAGIPLTIGFIGKFYLFVAGVGASLWVLVGVLIVGSGIGLFYYLRIIFAMTRRSELPGVAIAIPPAGGWVLASLVFVLLGLGVYPTPVVDLIIQMVGSFIEI